MKNLIKLPALLLLFSTVGLQAQTFSFVRISPYPLHGPADTTLSSYATTTNLTGSPITITINITNRSVMAGWDSIGMCTWTLCLAAGVYSFVDTLPIGSNNEFHVYFTPYGIPGNGSCTVTMTHQSTTISQDFAVVADPVSIKQISEVVNSFKLDQNYPNPFNPATKIGFAIPKSDYVDLRVYDILGREVTVLLSQQLNTGEYEIEFEAHNLASGMYYYRLQTGDNISVRKMTLVK
jgi:hypothetical protein